LGYSGNFPEQAGVYHTDWNDPRLELSSNNNARIMPATHCGTLHRLRYTSPLAVFFTAVKFYNKEFDYA
jgi:hypothetical protein